MSDHIDNTNSISSTPELSQVSGMVGIRWVSQSFGLFSKNPSIWVVMLIIYFGIIFLLTMVPVLVLLPTLLAPVFNAGFVYGARALDNGQMLEIDHLFAGFKQRLRGLFRLGMLYFIINLLIIAVISIIFESLADEEAINAMIQVTANMNTSTTLELQQILIQHPELVVALLKAMMIGLILSIPLVMASWFAPALVMFDEMSPFKAMLLSIKACNKNMLAFLIYGMLMLPLLLLALLPFGLGLLIILPVIFISQYYSYQSIFSQQQNDQGVFLV